MKMLTMTNVFPNYWYRLRHGLRTYLSQLKASLPFAIVNKNLIADLQYENKYLHKRAVEADQRWVDLNALMTHRAQQERGAAVVRQKGRRLNILAVKTSPGGTWEIQVE